MSTKFKACNAAPNNAIKKGLFIQKVGPQVTTLLDAIPGMMSKLLSFDPIEHNDVGLMDHLNLSDISFCSLPCISKTSKMAKTFFAQVFLYAVSEWF